MGNLISACMSQMAVCVLHAGGCVTQMSPGLTLAACMARMVCTTCMGC